MALRCEIHAVCGCPADVAGGIEQDLGRAVCQSRIDIIAGLDCDDMELDAKVFFDAVGQLAYDALQLPIFIRIGKWFFAGDGNGRNDRMCLQVVRMPTRREGLASALLLDKVMMKLTSKQRRRTRRAYDFSKRFPLLI